MCLTETISLHFCGEGTAWVSYQHQRNLKQSRISSCHLDGWISTLNSFRLREYKEKVLMRWQVTSCRCTLLKEQELYCKIFIGSFYSKVWSSWRQSVKLSNEVIAVHSHNQVLTSDASGKGALSSGWTRGCHKNGGFEWDWGLRPGNKEIQQVQLPQVRDLSIKSVGMDSGRAEPTVQNLFVPSPHSPKTARLAWIAAVSEKWQQSRKRNSMNKTLVTVFPPMSW